MNRRELLKYFTAGASIIPVVGGMPKMEAAANLIEVPKIEVPRRVEVVEAISNLWVMDTGGCEISVTIKKDGRVFNMEGRSFITRMVARESIRVGQFVCGDQIQMEWELDGVMTGAPKCTRTTS